MDLESSERGVSVGGSSEHVSDPHSPSLQQEQAGARGSPTPSIAAAQTDSSDVHNMYRSRPGDDDYMENVLPGYAPLLKHGIRQFMDGHEGMTLQKLYREDCRQCKIKALREYLHFENSMTRDGSEGWERVSESLREYSAATQRLEDFENRLPRYKKGSLDPDDRIIAIQQWALRAYEQSFMRPLQNDEAARVALEEETKHVAHMIRKAPAPGDSLRIIEDTDAQAERERRNAAYQAFWARFFMALFGGVALIVPMLVMSLHDTRTTSLATTSVFTFVVAVLLAWFMKTAEAKDVIGATAAYAAVLVVFVGSATQPIPTDDTQFDNPMHLTPGAITGIVLGCLFGALFLLLLLAFCCLDGLLSGLLVLFGIRKPRRKKSNVEVYTRDR